MKKKYASDTVAGGLLSALAGRLGGCAMISTLFLLASMEANAEASLTDVDGEHGILHVYGQLVDSPCRLSMASRDQTVDLGMLASGDLISPGARSQPVAFSVQLLGCLVASGHLVDDRSDSTVWGANQPVVSVGFTAPADFSDPSLMKLNGVQGVALRITDSNGDDMRLGSHGVPKLLTPGDNTLTWMLQAERVPGQLVPGSFQAVADFRMSYD